MSLESFANKIFTLVVLLIFFLLMYTRIKKQTFKETFTQVRELFESGKNAR